MASASPRRFVPPVPSAAHLAVAVVTGSALVIGAMFDSEPPRPSAGQAFSTPSAGMPGRTAQATLLPVQPLPPAKPVRLRIPAIGVNAPMTKLGLDKAGALKPPPAGNPNLVGWYGRGTAPGSTGTAVTAGHVDMRNGSPGVFYDLGALSKGDTIEISRADRRTAVFTVDAVEIYEKKKFPSKKVYGSTGLPELRVITCGGYAKSSGYQSNVVVYATLTAVKQPNGRFLAG
ncbi:class F sortase [Streptomyces sp. 142MFCol3.1]|uniref:class F sortase n=1 Tax=Streptomyces sp. 142MFCol3.1 TaxID=1172179 RepID=UPI0006852F87|nr:class F sortase [Streptomyces sp. 142MFCol3.1]